MSLKSIEKIRTVSFNRNYLFLTKKSIINLKICEYADYDPIANNITDPILKVIARYRNHLAYSP